jgi:hypothetical protein
MRTIICLVLLAIILLSISANAAKKPAIRPSYRESAPSADAPLPSDLLNDAQGPLQAAAAADTFLLHQAGFGGAEGPDPMGYTTVDLTDQIDAFFHVADGTELDGGQSGSLLPLSGSKSMWCGHGASTAVPYCGYATLPGYGNGWDQILESNALAGDSVSLSYRVFWDSEPGYDGTVVEYTFDNGSVWYSFHITDTLSARALIYDGTGVSPYITEAVTNQIAGSPGGDVRVRFRFRSDLAWSDEDGLWQTDGAIIVDDITVDTWAGGVPTVSNTQDFEAAPAGSNTAGIWTGRKAPAFGDYADLYPGVSVAQEDRCLFNVYFLWEFFDDPFVTNYACHTPNPLPGQGAMPFSTSDGIYMSNEIWSPPFDNTGSGDEYQLSFLVYRDLPLDYMQFYVWHVRSWKDPDGAGPLPPCPGPWKDFDYVYYGGQRDWLRTSFSIGTLVDPMADQIQVAVGALDGQSIWDCFWCTCHSHAPLIDDIRVERIDVSGPLYTVRDIDLFQDTFAEDGTLTGTARADAALDILPSTNPGILPGDSVVVTIAPVGIDPHTGNGPAAYAYVAVRPLGQTGKTPDDIEAPETRAGGKRWPLVGTTTIHDIEWARFRMDSVVAGTGGVVPNRYCIDFNDEVFTPGDTVFYFFAADPDGVPDNGNEHYWHKALQRRYIPHPYRYYTREGYGPARTTADINAAAASPCEMTILPAGGYNWGYSILYVDDADDRGGPVPDQLLFDSALDLMGMRDRIDRYDVLGPSSAVGNGLASRVKDNVAQIIDIYRIIIWNSGSLSSATIGDGTGNPEKSDDFGLLYQFLNTSDKGPGLYLSGDDIAEEWAGLTGAGAIQLRSTYMNHNLLDGDHRNFGEAVSPTFTASRLGGPFWNYSRGPEQFVGYGGCPLINDFDVLEPTGQSVEEFPYPNAGTGYGAAVISQATTNTANELATVVLSGLSYHHIHDAFIQYPVARAEHLRSIFIMFGQIVPDASGIDPGPRPQFANFLKPSYPNPFNPTTRIEYGIKKRAHVSLRVYNVAGQLTKTLVDEVQAPEEVKPVTWDGSNDTGQFVSSGVYFYKLATKGFSQTRKTVLLK